jgi:hypothetical protein
VLALLAKPKAGWPAPAAVPNAAPPKGCVGVPNALPEPHRLLLLPGAEVLVPAALPALNMPAALALPDAAVPASEHSKCRRSKCHQAHCGQSC